MKLKWILLSSVMLSLASCSSDDDQKAENNSIVGTWKAVSLMTPELVDHNGDGKQSNDILKEISCFTYTTTFNADGTQHSTVSDLEFVASEGNFTLRCNGSSSYMNSYKLEDRTLTTTDGEGVITSTVTLAGSKLTVEGKTTDFGDATIVFERQ